MFKAQKNRQETRRTDAGFLHWSAEIPACSTINGSKLRKDERTGPWPASPPQLSQKWTVRRGSTVWSRPDNGVTPVCIPWGALPMGYTPGYRRTRVVICPVFRARSNLFHPNRRKPWSCQEREAATMVLSAQKLTSSRVGGRNVGAPALSGPDMLAVRAPWLTEAKQTVLPPFRLLEFQTERRRIDPPPSQ